MNKATTPQPKVALHAPKTALGWLVLGKAVENGLAANPGLFPKPNPPLAQLSADVSALDSAQTATATRTRGTVADRNAKLTIVRADLHLVVQYVQGLADADPTNADKIAQAAGLSLRKSTTRSKSELSAKPNAKASGSVDLVAKLGTAGKAAHEWQYSTDGGKTWIAAQVTTQAKTTVTGLTPATSVVFRHRAVTKAGPDAWSQPVTLIVT